MDAPTSSLTITAPVLVTGGARFRPGWVRLRGGRVEAAGGGDPPEPAGLRLPDGVLAPGFVDLQVNGAYGADFAAATVEQWREVLARLPETGVTSLLPTFISAPVPALTDAVSRFRAMRGDLDAAGAARVLGLHIEGPFLAGSRRGAHRLEDLCDPTPERVDALLDAGGPDTVRCVTLAPEREGALSAVRRFAGAGVAVSIGHTDATEEAVRRAADEGATLVTHLYNAQRPLRHRDPGVVGAALNDPRLVCGIIVDLHHVAATAVRLAFAAAPGRIALVTDAVAAMGMPPGRYELGGEVLEVRAGEPPRRADGTLAGSGLRMDEAVANTVASGVDLAAAVDAATRVPADAVGHGDLGQLQPGCRADLVWLDEDLRARATWVDGILAHRRDEARDLLGEREEGTSG